MEAYGPVDFAKSIHTYIYIFNDIFPKGSSMYVSFKQNCRPQFFSISTSTKAMAYNTCAPVQRGSAERAVTIPPYHQGECLDFAKGKAANFPIGIQSLMKPVFFVDRFFGQHQWPLLVIIYILVPRGPIT